MPRRNEGEVSVDEEGRTYRATWEVDRAGVVTVDSFDFGRKATQVGDSPPESLARMMLREMIGDAKRR